MASIPANEQGFERRRYSLTPKGLDSLRRSIQQAQPWMSATGPRTPEGKSRSKMNALKHGQRSAEALAEKKKLMKLCTKIERLTARLARNGKGKKGQSAKG